MIKKGLMRASKTRRNFEQVECATSQRAHGAKATSNKRRCYALALHRCGFDATQTPPTQ